MTAAFILAINLAIAGIFAASFAVVAANNRVTRGAHWLAAGYGVGMFDVVMEFMLPQLANPLPAAMGIFLVFLLAMTLCMIGVARHYSVAVPWLAAASVWLATLAATPFIFTLPYATPLRVLLYQLPYVAMHVVLVSVIWRSRRRQLLDLLLMALNVAAALTYLGKPLVAIHFGEAGSPQGYMETTYAAISQSMGTVTLVSVALVLLLVIMRDASSEMMAQSEMDALSGVLNRRGFDAHAERMLERSRCVEEPLTMVSADLDHFKRINDSFGHAVGDGVIAHFAALLRNSATDSGIVSRVGGEEFAVLLAGADLVDGRHYAEMVRAKLSAEPLERFAIDRLVTASFGVAQMAPGESLHELCRRTDAALYAAKAGGRNRVNLALSERSARAQPGSFVAG